MRCARVASAALFLAWSVGCASVPRPTNPFRDPRQALLAQRDARQPLHSLKAEARVDQRGANGRIKGTVLMFAERPSSVRFDAMTQFGPVAILTSDGARFAYADLRSRHFTTGATCRENIARFLNLPLDVAQTTLLLFGGTPIIEHERESLAWNDDGFYRVVLRGADGTRQEIDLGLGTRDRDAPPEAQALRLQRSEVYDAKGKSRFRIDYDDYRAVRGKAGAVAMPFYVRVEQPAVGRDSVLRFKQIELDVEVPAGAFEQAPLPGMELEEASCD